MQEPNNKFTLIGRFSEFRESLLPAKFQIIIDCKEKIPNKMN